MRARARSPGSPSSKGCTGFWCSSAGGLAGVVCGCDLAAADPEEPVCDVMASEVFAIEQSASLGEAAAAMSALDIGCLPVLRGSWLAGILTRGDLERVGLPAADSK